MSKHAHQPDHILPASLGEALARAAARIDRVDARVLLREASGATAAQLVAFPERALSPDAARCFLDWLARREQGEPVLRRRRRDRVDVVQREQGFQRGGDGGVVVDDEDGGHGAGAGS